MAKDGGGAGTPPEEFDFARLAEISGGDAEFEREIAGEYINQAWTLLEEIARTPAARDPDARRRAAHTLKGSSRTIGALTVAVLAAQLERLGREDDTAAAALLDHARASLGATQAVLDGHFGSDAYRRAA